MNVTHRVINVTHRFMILSYVFDSILRVSDAKFAYLKP